MLQVDAVLSPKGVSMELFKIPPPYNDQILNNQEITTECGMCACNLDDGLRKR